MQVSKCPGGIAKSRRQIRASWTVAVLIIGFISSLAAQGTGSPAAGRHLASDWCSSCHVVGPASKRGSSNGAPTFTAIAGMKSTTAMALKVFI
jgi:mono/diheme cytochrome c family protein